MACVKRRRPVHPERAAFRPGRRAPDSRARATSVPLTNITSRGSDCATMNCAPSRPTRNPTSVFENPPTPDDAAGQRVLHQAAGRAGQQAGHRAERQGDVNHRHEHQVDRRGAANRQAGERRLQRQRAGEGEDDADDPHFLRLREASAASSMTAPRAGTRTISTSSSDEKSTAGRTAISRWRLGPRSDFSTVPIDEPLGIDAVDARRDDDIAGATSARFETRSMRERRIAVDADGHPAGPRALGDRARPRHCDR